MTAADVADLLALCDKTGGLGHATIHMDTADVRELCAAWRELVVLRDTHEQWVAAQAEEGNDPRNLQL